MENFGDTLLNLAEEFAFSQRKVYMFAAQLTLRRFSTTADGLIMLGAVFIRHMIFTSDIMMHGGRVAA
eukprot:6950520-Prymnesium_polylepis.1